jgi:hypothetical protein
MSHNVPGSARFMYILGAIILGGAVVWLGGMAIDGMGLEERTGGAVVTGKSHHEAGTTYTQRTINNRSYVVPQATPEIYALELDLDGQAAVGSVDRDMYAAMSAGDSVRVRYMRRRLTGGIDVVEVTKP